MRYIHFTGDDLVKYSKRFMYGTFFLNGVLFLKIREDKRERDLECKIYENINNGSYKYKYKYIE